MSWNRQNTGNDPSGKPGRGDASFGRRVRIHIATFLIVVAAVGIWVWRHGTGPAEAVSAERSERARPAARKVEKARPAAVPVAKEVPAAPKAVAATLLSAVTNASGRVIERFRGPDGRTYKVRRWAKPPLFKHATDDILSMLLTQRGGGPIPPIPYSDNMDQMFLESLKDPIVIDKDAPEEIQERQRIVREARAEVKALMDEGLSFREIAAEHEGLLNQNAALRAEALRELKKVRDEGDSEGTALFLESINETLDNMGIEPIEMPRRPRRPATR